MKRIFAAAVCALALFVLSSCSTPEQRVENYVKDNKSLAMASGYVYCDTELEARGTSVVYKIMIENDIDEDFTHEIIKEYRNMLDDEFEELYKSMKEEESAITSLVVEFCDYEGNVVVGYVYK